MTWRSQRWCFGDEDDNDDVNDDDNDEVDDDNNDDDDRNEIIPNEVPQNLE